MDFITSPEASQPVTHNCPPQKAYKTIFSVLVISYQPIFLPCSWINWSVSFLEIFLLFSMTGDYHSLNCQVGDSRTFWKDFDIHVNFQVNDYWASMIKGPLPICMNRRVYPHTLRLLLKFILPLCICPAAQYEGIV